MIFNKREGLILQILESKEEPISSSEILKSINNHISKSFFYVELCTLIESGFIIESVLEPSKGVLLVHEFEKRQGYLISPAGREALKNFEISKYGNFITLLTVVGRKFRTFLRGFAVSSILSLDSVLDFGKHEGEQVEDLIDDHPSYMVWLVENEIREVDDEVLEIMTQKGLI